MDLRSTLARRTPGACTPDVDKQTSLLSRPTVRDHRDIYATSDVLAPNAQSSALPFEQYSPSKHNPPPSTIILVSASPCGNSIREQTQACLTVPPPRQPAERRSTQIS
ncbi:hypothetical protein D9619_011285 [Psilocybe cf. subviscida]|uniref:Uncharacterized protein n=1 Tax=Psilocybe cf. subviscida TaxID=2480587 RepID=A0A8H5F569_9AGAR|nr:hypothetical protein D9619_011285 [Psilocybe cf. subviscida]